MLSNALQAPQIELVEVPAGEFTMGRLDGYIHSGREDPAHTVALETYRIGRYPVTNAQYRLFAEDTGHPFQDGKDDHPASGLTWQDAWLFCAWMRYKTGLPYHLPTEAEWEKAATWNPAAGAKQPYPWGNEPDDTRCNVLASGHKGTTPVGMYSPRGDSPYGCADMIGNVDEWCNTAMRAYPYNAGNGCETLGAEGRRAIRGGDWYTISPPSGIRRNAPSDAWVGLWGFRIALGDAVEQAQQEYLRRLDEWYRQELRERETLAQQEPLNAQRWYDLGAWLISVSQMGRNAFTPAEAALTVALRIMEAAPGHKPATLTSPPAWVFYNRAYARLELKQFDAALEDMSQAITLEASDSDAYMTRSQIRIHLRQWAEAQRDYEAALRYNRENPLQVVVQAQIAAGMQQYEQALKLMTEIIQRPLFNPLKRPEMHLYRGRVYEELGQTHAAMCDYCHYLLWRPDAPEAVVLTQMLEGYRTQRYSDEQKA